MGSIVEVYDAKILNNQSNFDKLLDDDDVRLCLLLALDFVFMGYEMRHVIANELLNLVDDLAAWNDFSLVQLVSSTSLTMALDVGEHNQAQGPRGYSRGKPEAQLLAHEIVSHLPSIQSVLGVFWIHSSVMGSDDWQNVTSKKHRRSKEDDVLNISKSVYVTNFPDSTSARDLWKVCSAYGTVVDVFIPFKKSKAGKRFAFVRFIKVFNLDRLVENLCTIWIGRFHLFANHVRFDRPQKPNHSPPKVPTTAHKNSFAAVLKDSNVKEASVEPAIVLDDSCIKEFDFNLSLMGKVNEVPTIPNLPVLIAKEGFLNVKIKYLGGMWLLFDFDSSASKQKFLAHAGVRSWFSILKQANNNFVNNERIIWVSVEGLPVKA
ncbi:RNA-directed DNA polymerase, eukaryota, nucleotide-binding alpha-beta plait domain protein [Tanacetum coccineum]